MRVPEAVVALQAAVLRQLLQLRIKQAQGPEAKPGGGLGVGVGKGSGGVPTNRPVYSVASEKPRHILFPPNFPRITDHYLHRPLGIPTEAWFNDDDMTRHNLHQYRQVDMAGQDAARVAAHSMSGRHEDLLHAKGQLDMRKAYDVDLAAGLPRDELEAKRLRAAEKLDETERASIIDFKKNRTPQLATRIRQRLDDFQEDGEGPLGKGQGSSPGLGEAKPAPGLLDRARAGWQGLGTAGQLGVGAGALGVGGLGAYLLYRRLKKKEEPAKEAQGPEAKPGGGLGVGELKSPPPGPTYKARHYTFPPSFDLQDTLPGDDAAGYGNVTGQLKGDDGDVLGYNELYSDRPTDWRRGWSPAAVRAAGMMENNQGNVFFERVNSRHAGEKDEYRRKHPLDVAGFERLRDRQSLDKSRLGRMVFGKLEGRGPLVTDRAELELDRSQEKDYGRIGTNVEPIPRSLDPQSVARPASWPDPPAPSLLDRVRSGWQGLGTAGQLGVGAGALGVGGLGAYLLYRKLKKKEPAKEAADQELHRYTTQEGEGAWHAGRRLLPGHLADEADQQRAWLSRPDLPGDGYEAWFTPQGADKYEQTLKSVHDQYLKLRKETGRPSYPVAYSDPHQVIFRKPALGPPTESAQPPRRPMPDNAEANHTAAAAAVLHQLLTLRTKQALARAQRSVTPTKEAGILDAGLRLAGKGLAGGARLAGKGIAGGANLGLQAAKVTGKGLGTAARATAQGAGRFGSGAAAGWAGGGAPGAVQGLSGVAGYGAGRGAGLAVQGVQNAGGATRDFGHGLRSGLSRPSLVRDAVGTARQQLQDVGEQRLYASSLGNIPQARLTGPGFVPNPAVPQAARLAQSVATVQNAPGYLARGTPAVPAGGSRLGPSSPLVRYTGQSSNSYLDPTVQGLAGRAGHNLGQRISNVAHDLTALTPLDRHLPLTEASQTVSRAANRQGGLMGKAWNALDTVQNHGLTKAMTNPDQLLLGGVTGLGTRMRQAGQQAANGQLLHPGRLLQGLGLGVEGAGTAGQMAMRLPSAGLGAVFPGISPGVRSAVTNLPWTVGTAAGGYMGLRGLAANIHPDDNTRAQQFRDSPDIRAANTLAKGVTVPTSLGAAALPKWTRPLRDRFHAGVRGTLEPLAYGDLNASGQGFQRFLHQADPAAIAGDYASNMEALKNAPAQASQAIDQAGQAVQEAGNSVGEGLGAFNPFGENVSQGPRPTGNPTP